MTATVKVPKEFEPMFEKAQEYVSKYFKEKIEDPSKGTIEIFGQRYILIRAASMSVDFFETVKKLYKDKGDEEALSVARSLLFDIAHAIGKADAKNFHKRMDLKDPIEKLSAGPVHFSHSGWAFVNIFPESRPSPDENYFLIYDHPFSFESDAWKKADKKSDFPVCVMNAGYSSGWCEESFGIPLVASEIMCRAKGDDVCRFIMAHPSKIEDYIKEYLKREPELAKKVAKYEIPGFFKRKHMEGALRRAHDELEIRVQERTTELAKANRALQAEIAERRRVEEEKDKFLHDLNERMKELNCLYEIAKIVEIPNISLEEIFQKTVDVIPPGWQYPDITCTRIAVEGQEFKTPNYKATKWKQSGGIKGDGKKVGVVEVCYLEERPEIDEGPFLKEERNLIEAIAERLGHITERKRAEEALCLQSEITANMSEGVYLIRASDGVIVYTNPKFEKIFGYGPDEMIGKHVSIVNAPTEKSPEETAKEISEFINKHGFWRGEINNIKKDGTPFWCYASVSMFDHPEHGRVWVVVHTDVTERKRAEEALRESEERYRDLFENANDLIQSIDEKGKFGYVNKKWKQVMGYSDEEVKRLTLADILRKDQVPHCMELFRKVAGGEVLDNVEAVFITKEGKEIFVSGAVNPRIKDGKFVATRGIFRDITERKQAEELLRTSEAQLSNAMKIAQLGYWEYDVADDLFTFNDHFYAIFRTSAEQVGGYKISPARYAQLFLHPDDMPIVAIEMKKALETTDPHFSRQLEHRIIYADGEIGYISVRYFIVKDNQGRTVKTYGANQDITERKRAEEKIRYFQKAVESASDAIGMSTPEGKHYYQNEAFTRLFGLTVEEVRGLEGPPTVYADKDVGAEVFRTIMNGDSWEGEVEMLAKSGRKLSIDLRAYAIKDEKDKVVGLVGMHTDITERKRAEDNLREAKEEAEEGNRLKSEFLANMSHEIRTPMNAIIGMTGITLDTDITDEQREYLSVVKESGYALLGLIDDILDLSKIEVDKIELKTIDFDLRTTIEGVADTLAVRASAKGLELACPIHNEVPTLLRGDPGRLRQVLMNLGGNAIKFTEKGEVVIRAELEEETEDQATLLFSVIDTGAGIPKDKQKKIFESFTQADGSATREYGGAGLGLSISKRLVELMGGQIGLDSQPGKGSRFWFTITFEKQKGFKEIFPMFPPDIRGMRMLVVDDNETNRTILVKMLESFGCCGEAAESGTKALQILKRAAHKEKLFDLVLLDMHMPGMDGEQTLRAIKDDPEIKDVVVIVLTSVGMRGDAARLEDLGCAGYLMKPLKQSQLFDTIITVLSRQKSRVKEKTIPIVTRHTIAEQKRRAVHILLAEDNPTNQKLAVTLLKKAGYSVDAVGNGRMAIEALKHTAYDLILMDVQMPEMNGFEATKVIRKREGNSKHTPIIAMTAHAMKGDRERCLQAGMDDYISKPIEPQELFDTIEKWTKSRDQEKIVQRQEQSKKDDHIKDVPTCSELVEPIDIETALSRFGGDKEFFKEMVEEFLNLAPIQLEKLTEAIEKDDAKVVEKEAHSIKGAAGNLEAKAFAEVALQMEILGRKKDLAGAKEVIGHLKAELKRLEECYNQSFKEKIAVKS